MSENRFSAMDDTFVSLIRAHFPRLAELLGDRELQGRNQEFERLGMVRLWQVERDLELLVRHVTGTEIKSAYQDFLRNSGHFLPAMYEIRAAAMLAPFAEKLELAPKVGTGRCDLKCTVRGQEVFVEVTSHADNFPPAYDGNVYGRTTVEKSFDPTSKQDDLGIRETPASKELRDRIVGEISQLPEGELTVLIVGAPKGRSEYMEWALRGDEIIRAREFGPWWVERTPNGLFCVPDEAGGVSRLSALVWMKLVPHFHDVRIHSRMFTNPLAARPLSSQVEELFRTVFDRREVLLKELERIKKFLIDKYDPERVILFGSLADDRCFRPSGGRRPDPVHEWSDIDLAIVKATPLRPIDRAREVVELVQPRVGLNVFVYTPQEFAQAEQEGHFFVRDEILRNGVVLFP